MTNNIAVLLTCHNRKDKTLKCLESLYNIPEVKNTETVNIEVFLTDDGSTDGTTEEISSKFPSVTILKAGGNLYWNGGMRNSWAAALRNDFNGFLLLNDDTILYDNIFREIIYTENYSIDNFQKTGIYVGSTIDSNTKKRSYGGSIVLNKFLNTYKRLEPNGIVQLCELGNANIMYVSNDVVKSIGILSSSYVHAAADYDYTLTARKNNIPVLLATSFCGECNINHEDKYEIFRNKNLIGRIKFLYHPTGLALPDQVHFMRKFYPYRLPILFLTAVFKLFFPNTYIKINNLRKF